MILKSYDMWIYKGLICRARTFYIEREIIGFLSKYKKVRATLSYNTFYIECTTTGIDWWARFYILKFGWRIDEGKRKNKLTLDMCHAYHNAGQEATAARRPAQVCVEPSIS
jgi:hypothetical protein